MEYVFDPETECNKIASGWKTWAETVGAGKFVIGISGGKDSTFLAWLAAKTFGPDNVYGVMMPNGLQRDISDSLRVVGLTKIRSYAINISNAVTAVEDQIRYNGVVESQDTKINLPPRIRMSVLYAVAQSVGGVVINTDQLDERILGYFTMYGDGAGAYAPIRDYTVTEVVRMGKFLGIPDDLICKKPGDGLQDKCDEDRFGFTYAALDGFIRENKGDDGFKSEIMTRFRRNRFKTDIVDIPGPASGLPNFVLNPEA